MRCRLPIKASAVVLYTGWLLMLPPFDGHGSVDTDAPLSRWAHFISYDTAKACQDALVSASDSTRRANGKDGKTSKRYLDARCVPLEAVYPPAKEP